MSGSQNATLTMTSAATVSVSRRIWKILSTGIAMTMAGTICMKISTTRIARLPGRLNRASE